MRWHIDLVFKTLKSHYRLDELPTSKAHIVQTVLLVAVITLRAGRRMVQVPVARGWPPRVRGRGAIDSRLGVCRIRDSVKVRDKDSLL